jgi:hypothetical protein
VTSGRARGGAAAAACRALLCAAALAGSWVPDALAGGAAAGVDLRTDPRVELLGAYRVAGAGDVNGDDVPDALVGDCRSDSAGRVYVVFGPFSSPARIALADFDGRGFRIDGGLPEGEACSPAGGGDVNGDGLDDVVVGARAAGEPNRLYAGKAYVVFGKTDTNPIRLGDFDQNVQGFQGFRIDGPSEDALAGEDVAGAGDVNRDGLADVLVAAPYAGRTYVVFGKRDPLPVDLLNFETASPAGYRIDTSRPTLSDGYSVANAGDVNGDGIADAAVGVRRTFRSRGAVFVVFGKTDSTSVQTADLGDRGFAIRGPNRGSYVGVSVAGAGDVNADGHDDVVIGAPGLGRRAPGAAFVVFGKSSDAEVDLRNLGTAGYRLAGGEAWDAAGESVAGLGDVNGDGLGDVAVAAGGSGYNDRPGSGSIYVVFGKTSSARVHLGELGPGGYRIDGARRGDGAAGTFVAGLGDVDGDDVPDVISGFVGRRRAYVTWGNV